ncbi:MAG: BON domain-containing protein [Firmicutes bacterium]|nr:BON domain-containing protein [Bacillota bacterium]
MISAHLRCGRRWAGLWVLALVAAAVATLVTATALVAASEPAGAHQVQQAQEQVHQQAQQVQQAGAVAPNRTFAVVVGESRILQVNGLVRVAIADPAIADVVVVSKTEVIVNGKGEGRTTLHVWDASGRSSYDVRVCVDNAGLIREIEETIGISGVRARFARSTLLLDGSVETDADSERAELIAKAYADKVLNLLTVRRPALPPPPPVVEASEVQAAIGVKGVSVRVLKDAVILEGQVESPLDSDRAEKIARIFTNHVLNFIVVNPPLPVAGEGEGEEGKGEAVTVAPPDGEPRPAEPGVQRPAAAGAGAGAGAGAAAGTESVSGEAGTGSGQAPAAAPETMTFSPELEVQAGAAGGEAAGEAEATSGAEPGAPEKIDPDVVLRNTIVAAVRDPTVEVTVVKGTVLLEGLVSSDYAKLRAETVARLYAPNVVSILRVAEPLPSPPSPPSPSPAPSLPASPPPPPEPRLEDKVSAYINMPTVKVRSVDGKLLLEGSVASQNELERVGKIAAMFSNDVVNLVEMTDPVQVLLQVNVIEVNRSSLKNLGVTWGGVSGERIEPGSFLFGEVNFPPLPPLPTDLDTWDAWRKLIPHGSPVEEIWRLSSIRAVLDFLVNEDAAKVLAAPSLLTLSGKQADFLVGGEIPIYVGRSDGKIAFEWRPYGIKLTMLPIVDTRGRIAIDVQPEVSSLDWNNALDVGDAVIPALKVRRASTHLVVADGATIAIGGLLQNTDVKIVKKLPILGDIPIIGSLFKSDKFERGETELVILITPKVVRAGEAVTRDMMVKPATVPAPAPAPPASGGPGK